MSSSQGVDPAPAPSDREGFAIASLVLGIFSLLLFFLVPIIDIFTSILGFIFGILSLKSENRGLAITGLILSGIVLVIYFIGILILILFGAAILSLLN